MDARQKLYRLTHNMKVGIDENVFEFKDKWYVINGSCDNYTNSYIDKISPLREDYDLNWIEDGVYTWMMMNDKMFFKETKVSQEIQTKHANIAFDVMARLGKELNYIGAGEFRKIGNEITYNFLSGTYSLDVLFDTKLIKKIFNNFFIGTISYDKLGKTYISNVTLPMNDDRFLFILSACNGSVFEFDSKEEATEFGNITISLSKNESQIKMMENKKQWYTTPKDLIEYNSQIEALVSRKNNLLLLQQKKPYSLLLPNEININLELVRNGGRQAYLLEQVNMKYYDYICKEYKDLSRLVESAKPVRVLFYKGELPKYFDYTDHDIWLADVLGFTCRGIPKDVPIMSIQYKVYYKTEFVCDITTEVCPRTTDIKSFENKSIAFDKETKKINPDYYVRYQIHNILEMKDLYNKYKNREISNKELLDIIEGSGLAELISTEYQLGNDKLLFFTCSLLEIKLLDVFYPLSNEQAEKFSIKMKKAFNPLRDNLVYNLIIFIESIPENFTQLSEEEKIMFRENFLQLCKKVSLIFV